MRLEGTENPRHKEEENKEGEFEPDLLYPHLCLRLRLHLSRAFVWRSAQHTRRLEGCHGSGDPRPLFRRHVMAEVPALSLELLEILIKWKSGELLEHTQRYGGLVFCSGHSEDLHVPLLSSGGGVHGRTGETPGVGSFVQSVIMRTAGPSTNGTDGLEESLQSLIVERLRRKDVNWGNLGRVLVNYELEWKSLTIETDQMSWLFTQIRQIIHNVRNELLEMRYRYLEMSLEEFKAYYVVPMCWSSRKRLEFFCGLSDRLSLKATNQEGQRILLLRELESKRKKPLFYGKWNDGIDPNFRADAGNSSQCKYNYKSVVDLLRFIRNNWHHRLEFPEEFKEKFTGRDGEKHFYNYFDKLFPDLLMVSYKEAYLFCREEKWFEEYQVKPSQDYLSEDMCFLPFTSPCQVLSEL